MVSIGALAQINWQNPFLDQAATSAGKFIPSLIGAIAILVVGWLVATLVAFVVKSLLSRLQVDRRLSGHCHCLWLGGPGCGLRTNSGMVKSFPTTINNRALAPGL